MRCACSLPILIALAGCSGWAASIGQVAINPASTNAGVGANVVVTAVITDTSIVATSVNLQRLDALGRVVAVVGNLADDGKAGDAVANDKTFSLRFTVYEQQPGLLTYRVSAAVLGSLTRIFSSPLSFTVAGTVATGITISQPANLVFVNTSPIVVSGTTGDPGAAVKVNGINAPKSANSYQTTVPLQEGNNTITAVATNTNGSTSTASIQITLDTTPPKVTIDSPVDGSTTTETSATVTGIVNDIVVGTVNSQQAQVTVNGIPASVANRTYSAANVPLSLGLNTLQVIARDQTGNSATTSAKVTRQAVTQPFIKLISGNNQSGIIGTQLGQALVAQLLNGATPVPNTPVVFKVVENDGFLAPGATVKPQLIVVNTNGQGQAQAFLTLGTRAGAGNNTVEAYATGFQGTAIYVASGNPKPPAKINVDSGNNQFGPVSQPLALPFVAVVTDEGHNRLGGVPVTFTVRQGGGNIGGATAKQTITDGDGRALVTLTLGSQPGQENNVVEATFQGNPGQVAAFAASAKVPGDPNQTAISGLVLDNSNMPILGVTMRLFQTNQGNNNSQPMQVVTPVVTDAKGMFKILPSPVGFYKLMADGTTATGTGKLYPTLEYDIVTVAGQDNNVGMPIYLPALDPLAKVCVNETTGGVLKISSSPGFSLTIGAGAATFPGGSKTGCVSVTPVNPDKVPMVPGFGQQPKYVVTIQPVGTIFNPPAAITIPNMDGLAPNAKTEMYSYDHDLAAFVAIGSGTVTPDGSVIASDPGVGVIKAGWHCGGNPNTTGSAGTCAMCNQCQGSQCVPDNGQTPPQASPTDCKKQVCSGGSVVSQNNDAEQQSEPCVQCSNGSPSNRPNGVTPPADSNKCCFDGDDIDKAALPLGGGDSDLPSQQVTDRLNVLSTKCPNKSQDSKLHSIDGCSTPVFLAILTPGLSVQDPVGGTFGLAGTRFGQAQAPISHATAPLNLPCNRHDICYQTCGSTQAGCDTGMENDMTTVCNTAYPNTFCPYSGAEAVLKCFPVIPLVRTYFEERIDCAFWTAAYKLGLDQFGGGPWSQRQAQYCKCCQ